MADWGDVQAALEEAARRRTERDGLARRLEAAMPLVSAAAREVESARARLTAEEQDVAKLESFSPTRIWASLRDTRLTDLERETAERDKAAYDVAVEEARRARLEAECRALEAELAGLADVDQRWAEALDSKEAWLRDSSHPSAPELAELAEQRGALQAQRKELTEALAASRTAANHLAEAVHFLRGARDWSDWDTFAGGGLFSDLVKYDRLDEATISLREADVSLKALSRELADLGMAALGGVQVTGLTRGLDLWFDNIFSDMAVRSRVMQADDVTRALHAQVLGVHTELTAELAGATDALAGLTAQRERILHP